MKVIDFGEGRVLVRWFHSLNESQPVMPCGVSLEIVSEPHEIGSTTGEPEKIVVGDVPSRDVMLRFSNTESLDVLIEELVSLRLKFSGDCPSTEKMGGAK